MTKAMRGIWLAVLALALTGCAGVVRDRIFQPVPIAETPVTFAGEAPRPVEATTADGLALAGYYWPAKDGNRDLLIVFHGNSYNQLVSAARSEPFASGGHGVLVASYRGYGDNPGEPSEAGLFADGDAWLAKARELAPGANVHLFGHSLGGAVALEMAARHEVASVSTLGTFASMADMVPSIARGSLKDRFDNRAAIARIAEPIYLYHGDKDATVPFAMAEELRQASGGKARVIPLQGGGHHVPMDRFAALLWDTLGKGE